MSLIYKTIDYLSKTYNSLIFLFIRSKCLESKINSVQSLSAWKQVASATKLDRTSKINIFLKLIILKTNKQKSFPKNKKSTLKVLIYPLENPV